MDNSVETYVTYSGDGRGLAHRMAHEALGEWCRGLVAAAVTGFGVNTAATGPYDGEVSGGVGPGR